MYYSSITIKFVLKMTTETERSKFKNIFFDPRRAMTPPPFSPYILGHGSIVMGNLYSHKR